MSDIECEKCKVNKYCGTCITCEQAKEMYEQGRADELDKISKMMLLGCDELKCEECDYRLYSQDVCQQAYTIGIIEKYITEQLKEQNDNKP